MIRELKPGDVSVVIELSKHLAQSEEPIEEMTNRLRAMLDSLMDVVWVFEVENKIVAWIHVFHTHRVTAASFIEIGGMIVDPEYRRQGIATSLIQKAKSWAYENTCKLRVRSDIRREGAHEFYIASGFAKIKDQEVFEISK